VDARSPKPVYLPLRIVPRRRVQYTALGLQVLGLALLLVAASRPFSGDWQLRAGAEPIAFGLLVSVLTLAVLGVGWTIAMSLFRLLPASPLSHVQLTWPTIAIRSPLGPRQFTWDELGRFTVVTAPNDYEATYIVAGRSNQDAGVSSDRGRYRHAVFRLRSDAYCGTTEAEILARWLNEIQSAVAGRTPGDIAFFAPTALSGNVHSAPGAAQH
jgi:YD repeat-containing protein